MFLLKAWRINSYKFMVNSQLVRGCSKVGLDKTSNESLIPSFLERQVPGKSNEGDAWYAKTGTCAAFICAAPIFLVIIVSGLYLFSDDFIDDLIEGKENNVNLTPIVKLLYNTRCQVLKEEKILFEKSEEEVINEEHKDKIE